MQTAFLVSYKRKQSYISQMQFTIVIENCLEVDIIKMSSVLKNIIYHTNTTDTHRPPILTGKIFQVSKSLLENIYKDNAGASVIYSLDRPYNIAFSSRRIPNLHLILDTTYEIEYVYLHKANNASFDAFKAHENSNAVKKRRIL